MEGQMEATEAPRRLSRQDEVDNSNAPASSRQSDPIPQRPSSLIRDDDVFKNPEVVYLCDHHGSRYVFPFDRLRSYEDAQNLWKEIYQSLNQSRRSKRENIRSIEDGSYRIQTTDGATILPSAWDALVRPDSIIQIEFTDKSPMYPSTRSRSWSRSSSRNAPHLDRVRDNPEDVRAVTFEVRRPISPTPRSESAATTADDSTGSYTSDSDEKSSSDELEIDLDRTPPPRNVVAPVDSEGNTLSFHVKTKQPAHLSLPPKGPGNEELEKGTRSGNKNVTDNDFETRRIIKALMTKSEGRNMLEISTLPGPENIQLQASVATTWYHIRAAQLDFDRFRNVCLTIPNLSSRLQILTREMLMKLHKDKVKPFLGGRFIEPSTVLRADESDQTDPQSIIFSCVPYFGLEQVKKKLPGLDNPLFPPRTLMQSFYPYEPVRERDEEQSYRKFSNDHSHNIVHVPNLWIMNIGSSIVVTCGHEPLLMMMGSSITIIEENVRQVAKEGTTENKLTEVCITNLDGRKFVLPISSCRSYFQLEAKVLELNYTPGGRVVDNWYKLELQSRDGSTIIRPEDWMKVVSRAADLVVINITVSNDQDDRRPDGDAPSSNHAARVSSTFVPPFFHWSQSKNSNTSRSDGKLAVPGPLDPHGPTTYLDQVEKAMTLKTLEGPHEIVEYAFESIDYYRALPEAKFSEVCTNQVELEDRRKRATQAVSGITLHQKIIRAQTSGILDRSGELFDTIHQTLKLFVDDLDCNITLRKVSGALKNINEYVIIIEQRGSFEPGLKDYTDPDWKDSNMMDCAWLIRTSAHPHSLSLPDASDRLKKSILRCKRCRRGWFLSPQAALNHVERHAAKSANPTVVDDVSRPQKPSERIFLGTEAHDWVINKAQYRREHTNAGALAILTHACTIAKDMLSQTRDLAEGVRNEDGRMSLLYSMPQELVEAFRRIVVFYLATERALYETGKIYEQSNLVEDSRWLPYSDTGLAVLRSFGRDAQRSLRVTRLALCKMARSEPPLDISKHLSMGPEFVCAWLMRRLLVKPLEKSNTIGDMFREYVSKVQFEVNDRPSKRLLRAINLIQEELQVLISVNTWQTNLVRNYMSVLDDSTYEPDIPSRRGMFPYERALVDACLDNLSLAREDYVDLIRRCGPLSERTKQMLEINEEDHGKAIMVFTVVTVIFLPLSFVTSYFGMNTSDLRDMNQGQSLFWSVAIPLTLVTVGSCLLIGYNSDDMRRSMAALYHGALGKDKKIEAGGLSVPQRKRPLKLNSESSTTTNSSSAAGDAEFASLLPEMPAMAYQLETEDAWYDSRYETSPRWHTSYEPTYRPEVRTQAYAEPISMAPPPPPLQQAPRYRSSRLDNYDMYDEFVEGPNRRERSRYDDIYADPRERSHSKYYPNRTRPNHFIRRNSVESVLRGGPPPISTRSGARRAEKHDAVTSSNWRVYGEDEWIGDRGDEYKWVRKSQKQSQRRHDRGNPRYAERHVERVPDEYGIPERRQRSTDIIPEDTW